MKEKVESACPKLGPCYRGEGRLPWEGGGMVDRQPDTAGPQYKCGEAEPRDQAVDVSSGE